MRNVEPLMPPARHFDPEHYDDRPPRSRSSARLVRWALTIVGVGALLAGGIAVYVGAARKPALVVAGTPAAAPLTARPAAPAASAPAIARSQPSAAAPPLRPPMPNVDQMVLLIRTAVMALDQANTTADYGVLRELAAPELQDLYTPAALTQLFVELRKHDIDLGSIAAVNPRLAADPTISPQGLLRMTGFFPGRNGQVNFELAYQPVANRWRLRGIAVNLAATPSPASAAPPTPTPARGDKVPDDDVLIALIRNAVLCLAQANTTGDYSVLREISAPSFQNANPLDKLAAAFAPLRARQLDLSPITIITPRLFRKASIEDHGYLRLTGYFPSRPEQVNFDLAFQFDHGQWRIFGIGVNTSRIDPTASADAVPSTGAGAKPAAEAIPAPAPVPSNLAR